MANYDGFVGSVLGQMGFCFGFADRAIAEVLLGQNYRWGYNLTYLNYEKTSYIFYFSPFIICYKL